MKFTLLIRGFVLLAALTASAGIVIHGQQLSGVVMGIPTPVIVSGTPTCADLNASSDPAFAHIQEDWGLKINRSSTIPYNDLFFFVNGADTQLMGGAGPSPASRVRVAAGGNIVNWMSNRSITAVILQGGLLGANVYPYNPGSFGGFPAGDGTGLVTAGGVNVCPAADHIIFCFQSLEPTASSASVSGRVVDMNGRGILGAQLTLSDAQTGESRGTMSNSLGYFVIEGAPVGGVYTLTAVHRRYTFVDNTRTFRLDEDLQGINFIASP